MQESVDNPELSKIAEIQDSRLVVYLSKSNASLFVEGSEINVHMGLRFGHVYWQPDSPVIVAGTDFFGFCLGMHPPNNGYCKVDFRIPSGARFFRSQVGLARQDTAPNSYGACDFYVSFALQLAELDKVKPTKSIFINGGSTIGTFDLGSMDSFRYVRLAVASNGSNWADHATWCDARFTD